MNKKKLQESVGQLVRLRPSAQDQTGRVVDDWWSLDAVADPTMTLRNQRTDQVATLGFDHIIKYTTDPSNTRDGVLAGFLNVGVSVRMGSNQVDVEPLLTPGVRVDAIDVAILNPLVVRHDNVDRWFSWRGRGAVHLVQSEEEPRQLLGFFRDLCDAIRAATPFEPEFNLSSDIRGEIVYEVSADGSARWKLLGGMNGLPASQVLVVRR